MEIENLIEEGKIKRVFRGRKKISYPGACCHITQRAPGRELLFLEESDYLYMLHLLKDKAMKFCLEIYSFSLLPNHFHLQMRLKQANLSLSMKSICETYAKMFNKKYNRKGHVFSSSYRQALCFDDSYLLITSLYIHLNPVRAGLVKAPQDYRWSSYRLYAEDINKDTFVNYKFILNILHEDINKARRLYNEIINRSISIKIREIWNYPNAVEDFRWKVVNFIRPLFKKVEDITPNSKDIFKEDFLEEKISKIKENKYKPDLLNFETRKYLIEQLRASGYKMDEIAEKLKLSRKTLYNSLRLHRLHKTSITQNV